MGQIRDAMGKPMVRQQEYHTYTPIQSFEEGLTRWGTRKGSDQYRSQKDIRRGMEIGRQKDVLSLSKIIRSIIF